MQLCHVKDLFTLKGQFMSNLSSSECIITCVEEAQRGHFDLLSRFFIEFLSMKSWALSNKRLCLINRIWLWHNFRQRAMAKTSKLLKKDSFWGNFQCEKSSDIQPEHSLVEFGSTIMSENVKFLREIATIQNVWISMDVNCGSLSPVLTFFSMTSVISPYLERLASVPWAFNSLRSH